MLLGAPGRQDRENEGGGGERIWSRKSEGGKASGVGRKCECGNVEEMQRGGCL